MIVTIMVVMRGVIVMVVLVMVVVVVVFGVVIVRREGIGARGGRVVVRVMDMCSVGHGQRRDQKALFLHVVDHFFGNGGCDGGCAVGVAGSGVVAGPGEEGEVEESGLGCWS